MNSKEKWLKTLEKEGKLQNPKEDHSRGLRALQNSTRREILRFIGKQVKTIEEIVTHFNSDESTISFHLSMLEQALFIEKVNDRWGLTPRGIGYLENVELK
jgi:DNA-binding transcriptional ArsR family regulator